MWDYAELSKAAKEAGGPEKLLNTLEKVAASKGKQSMTPWLLVAFLLGTGATYGCKKLYNFFKKKKSKTQAEIDATKAEIIKGIKDYDDNHPCENAEEISEDSGKEVNNDAKKEI